MIRRGAQSGFTLVEMLVALLLFGIVATVAAALTAGATRSFAATDTALADLGRLDRARLLLAADLGQAAPRPSRGAENEPMAAFTLMPQGFVLVRRGVQGTLPSVQKVAWGFDGGRLLRQTFPTVDGSAPGPASVILPDVQAVRLRVHDGAWRDRWAPPRPDALPRALELTVVTGRGVPVVLRFLLPA